MKTRFNNANEAYEGVIDEILQKGIDFGDTKAIFNCGFYIDNPSDKVITNVERKWSEKYAAAEWSWYLSGDPSVDKLAEIYMAKYHRYGNAWLMSTVRLILIMVINGKETIS